MLIVLDNCEHLLEAAARFVDEVLRATSRVHFLTTSREVLNLPGERITVLNPQSTAGERTPAIALFESRARDVLPGFTVDDTNRDAVRRVCERLDGLPLAIEPACARLRVLSVHELAERLSDGVDLLSTRGRGGAERHQSLQAAMAWSHRVRDVPRLGLRPVPGLGRVPLHDRTRAVAGRRGHGVLITGPSSRPWPRSTRAGRRSRRAPCRPSGTECARRRSRRPALRPVPLEDRAEGFAGGTSSSWRNGRAAPRPMTRACQSLMG
jgi:hypothetical protein